MFKDMLEEETLTLLHVFGGDEAAYYKDFFSDWNESD